MIPGLGQASFIHLGSVHRNSFMNSRKLLNWDLSSKKYPNLSIADQITGVEGYTESASPGLYVAYNLVKKLGAEEFAPYVCMSDIALSNAFEWGLIRTQTLADGREFCDFRFKKGGDTKISSRTPEVQETIKRIGKGG